MDVRGEASLSGLLTIKDCRALSKQHPFIALHLLVNRLLVHCNWSLPVLPTTMDQGPRTDLRRQFPRLQILLRANPEGVGYAVEEGEHSGDIDGFGDLILTPPCVANFLDIFAGGARSGVRHLFYVVEQRALGRIDSSLV
jgi:hypothetical protein